MSIFLKEFNYNTELIKMKNKYGNSYITYGLIGEERVAFQLKKCKEDILCLYNIILKVEDIKVQFDYIVISHDIIYILEVKNLLGNVMINEDLSVIRTIYKNNRIEQSGMENPFIQIEYQIKQLELFLNSIGYNKKVRGLLIMANDKTIITNKSSYKDIYKYEQLNNYFIKNVKGIKLQREDFIIGDQILKNHLEYNYLLVNVIKDNIKKQYIPIFKNKIDEKLYIKLIELRSHLSKKINCPPCNIYTNKSAELLVKNKPTNKKEFISVPGFKEKKYNIFGEEVINIFKNK